MLYSIHLMNYTIFILFGIVLFLLFLLTILYLFLKKTQTIPKDDKENQALLLLQKQIDSLNSQILQQLGHMQNRVDARLKDNAEAIQQTHKQVGDRIDNAARAYSIVTGKLAQIEEANKRIYDIGKDIVSLQEILRAPKLRGTLGELFLGDLLSQILPTAHYTTQHAFKNREVVDAIIRLRDGVMIPIDAKFPLENFKKMLDTEDAETKQLHNKQFIKDVKNRINEIATKYILPDEGTLDFALMYIPAENVYYETIIKGYEENDLVHYSHSKHVIPVSPNTLYIYLQAILLGLRGMQIEKGAQEILKNLGRLRGDFEKFGEDFRLVGKHITHASRSFEDSEKRLNTFGEKLETISTTSEEEKIIE